MDKHKIEDISTVLVEHDAGNIRMDLPDDEYVNEAEEILRQLQEIEYMISLEDHDEQVARAANLIFCTLKLSMYPNPVRNEMDESWALMADEVLEIFFRD